MPPSPRRTTILVVEDDPDLRAMYRTALQVEGFLVIAVPDGVDALRHVDEAPPDLVVLDLGLPHLGGGDVQRELADHPETRDIPIILVTGSDSELDEGAFACVLRKPIDGESLVDAVRRCLRKRP